MSDKNVTIGFKASSDFVAKVDAAAEAEGLSRADIARRAVIRDMAGAFGAPAPGFEKQEDAA